MNCRQLRPTAQSQAFLNFIYFFKQIMFLADYDYYESLQTDTEGTGSSPLWRTL